MATARRNVAVFIDAENLFGGYGQLRFPALSTEEMIDIIVDRADEAADAGKVAVARAYADWDRDGLKEYRREVERGGAKAVGVYSAGRPEKNAADIELVIDALRYADDDSLEVFAIVSGDGDFVPLVRRLHELGKFVVGATLENHTSNGLLQREVDLFLTLPAAEPEAGPAEKRASSPESAESSAKRPAQKKAAAKKQAAKKSTPEKSAPAKPASTKQGTTKQHPAKQNAAKKKQPAPATPADRPAPTSSRHDWHALAQKIPVVHPGPVHSAAEYKDVLGQLLSQPRFQSYCDKLCDNGGALPRLAMAIKVGAPEMSPSDAGVRNLSRALRFALAGTQYALAQPDEDSQMALVKRSSKSPNMLPDLSLDDITRGVQ